MLKAPGEGSHFPNRLSIFSLVNVFSQIAFQFFIENISILFFFRVHTKFILSKDAFSTLSPPHFRRVCGNLLDDRVRLSSPVTTSTFVCNCHNRNTVYRLEPADKRTAAAASPPRAAGWYSICKMHLSRRDYGLSLGLLHLPDPQLVSGAKCNSKALRRAH